MYDKSRRKDFKKGSKKDFKANNKRTNKDRSSRKDYRDRTERSDDNNGSYDPKPNHPAWYNRFGDLTASAGSINFLNKAGNPIQFYGNSYGAVPGLAILNFVPSVGSYVSETGQPFNAAINVNARRLYDRINYKNSRNWSYDASDLMEYMIAVDSAVAFHANLCRIYGLMNGFNAVNRYIPYAIIEALGFDFEDLKSQMADFRYYINRFALDMSALIIPSSMTLFDRHKYLNSTIFADANLPKGQLYAYRQTAYYNYCDNVTIGEDDQTLKGGICYLNPMVPASHDLMTLQEIIAYGDGLVKPLLGSQDINNMSTDILKAVENNYYKWEMIPDNYVTQVSFDASALIQIHNAFFPGKVAKTQPTYQTATKVYNFSSTEGLIYHQPDVSGLMTDYKIDFDMEMNIDGFPETPTSKTILLDTIEVNPSPENIASMTRMVPEVATIAGTAGDTLWKGKMAVVSCGSEIPETIDFWYYNNEGELASSENNTSWVLSVFSSEAGAGLLDQQIAYVNMLTKFDMHPSIYIAIVTSNDGNKGQITYTEQIGDLYTYTTLQNTDLERLHETCLLSELYVE